MTILALASTITITLYLVFRVVPAALRHYGQTYFPELLRPDDHPAVGLSVSAAITVMACWLAPHTPHLWPWFGLVAGSLYGVWRCDQRYQIIPDRFHVYGAIGVVGVLLTTRLETYLPYIATTLALSLALPLSLWGLNALYERFRGRTGLGFGDIKLLFWISLLLGDFVYLGLFAACGMALAVRLPQLLRCRELHTTFAFGPYLAASTLAMMVFI